MSGFLYQIEREQRKVIEQREQKKNTQKKVNKRSNQSRMPCSSVVAAFRVIHQQVKENSMDNKLKILGVPTPINIHERIEAFLARHKGDATLPQTKKAFGLACIVKFLDDDAGADAGDITASLPTFDEPVNPV